MCNIMDFADKTLKKARGFNFEDIAIIKIAAFFAGIIVGTAFANVFKKKIIMVAMIFVVVVSAAYILNEMFNEKYGIK